MLRITSCFRDALSWLLTGTVVLLVLLFSAMIVRDYGRETAAARQNIEEKGSVLIRALESGTRVGMGMRMHHAQLQALLEEMAWQPGVLWFAVTDENGKIIAHSDPQQVDTALYSPARKCVNSRLASRSAGAGLPSRNRRWRFIASFARLTLLVVTIWG